MGVAPTAQAGAMANTFDSAADWSIDVTIADMNAPSTAEMFDSDFAVVNPCNQNNPFGGGLLGAVGDLAVGTFNPTCSTALVVAGIVVGLALVIVDLATKTIDIVVAIAVDLAVQYANAAIALANAIIDILIGLVQPVVYFVDAVVVATCTALTGNPNCI